MSETNIMDLGISKNLLQMNFMRRTLVDHEKSNDSSVKKSAANVLIDVQDFAFEIPTALKNHLNKVASVRKKAPKITLNKSLSAIFGIPLGFRESYGGFNTVANRNSSEKANTDDPVDVGHVTSRGFRSFRSEPRTKGERKRKSVDKVHGKSHESKSKKRRQSAEGRF